MLKIKSPFASVFTVLKTKDLPGSENPIVKFLTESLLFFDEIFPEIISPLSSGKIIFFQYFVS